MVKKISIKPKSAAEPANLDQWVASRDSIGESPVQAVESASAKPEKIKRLTLDISESLHKAIKKEAADRGVPMADMLRELLEAKYRNTEIQK